MPRPRTPIWQEDDKVREAFLNAKTMSEIILKLGQPLGSASFLNCKRAAERLNLEVPIYVRDMAAANLKSKIPLEQILVEKSTYTNRQSLKSRLIRADMKEDKCESCGQLPLWNNRHLTLQLDHINGIGDDNRLENLQIICPNCHTQTSTFGFRNKK